MNPDEHNQLVPIQRRLPATRRRSQLPEAIVHVSRSLALFVRSPLARRAAAVGLAFGAGWQLSRSQHGGQLARLPGITQSASRISRSDPAANDGEPPRLVWVRRSFMRVSVLRRSYPTEDE